VRTIDERRRSTIDDDRRLTKIEHEHEHGERGMRTRIEDEGRGRGTRDERSATLRFLYITQFLPAFFAAYSLSSAAW